MTRRTDAVAAPVLRSKVVRMSHGNYDSLRCFALLTPAGMGAVATFACRGPEVARALAEWFFPVRGQSLPELPVGRPVFGHWGRAAPDEVVLTRVGPDTWELHVHGGAAVVERLRQDLRSAGAREQTWQEWLADQWEDRLAAEAAIDLASALTRRTAEILLDQRAGALRSAVVEVLDPLRHGATAVAQAQLAALRRRASLGCHLIRPWRVVVAGRTNAGKSSLTNALVGFERAIVDAQPGTTRDLVTSQLAIDGWPVTLIDSAGQSAASEPLEAAGIALAHRTMDDADLVLWVVDATAPELDAAEQARLAACRRVLVVYNKIDLTPPPAKCTAACPAGEGTSARTGEGLEQLLAAIAAALVPEVPPPGAAVPFRPEHVQRLEAAAAALDRSQPNIAAELLASWLALPTGTPPNRLEPLTQTHAPAD